MVNNEQNLLGQFERFEIDAPSFHHSDHVEVAYAMLNKYDFVDACARYATTIREMAKRVGALKKFNMTITFAFMSLIAERKQDFEVNDFTVFLEANPDLLDKKILNNWYSGERLTSATARSLFLLPDKTVGQVVYLAYFVAPIK